jgi:hypothetical protein
MNCNTVSYIPSPATREDGDANVDCDTASTNDDDSNGELVEPYDDKGDLDTYMAQIIDENNDNFEDFLMLSYNPDIDLDGNHDIGNENILVWASGDLA